MFAIVELLRAVAAFMVAPIFVYFASTVSSNLDTGTGFALWVGLAIAISGIVVSVGIYLLSGARPQRPDLDVFLEGTKSAWYSPPLLTRVWPGKAVAIPDVPVTEGIDPDALDAARGGHDHGTRAVRLRRRGALPGSRSNEPAGSSRRGGKPS